MPEGCLKYDMLTEVALYPLTLLLAHIFATYRSLAHWHGGPSRDAES